MHGFAYSRVCVVSLGRVISINVLAHLGFVRMRVCEQEGWASVRGELRKEKNEVVYMIIIANATSMCVSYFGRVMESMCVLVSNWVDVEADVDDVTEMKNAIGRKGGGGINGGNLAAARRNAMSSASHSTCLLHPWNTVPWCFYNHLFIYVGLHSRFQPNYSIPALWYTFFSSFSSFPR